MVDIFANSEDPDQTPRSAAFDLGLHCLPVTRFQSSRGYYIKKEKYVLFKKKLYVHSQTRTRARL